ncbi:MAG: alpha/beta hydrolase [Lewinellaceae bacterium]|nr:alpha/beta hydrolase [Lewinellaceae bacterium]
MEKVIVFLGLIITSYCQVNAQLPQVSAGTLQRVEQFSSRYVAPRNIDIWLPPGYNDQQKYPVLYMHDGQMLFDSVTTWNKQDWMVDEIITSLMTEGVIPGVIVVGVWNGGALRHCEYFPQQPFQSLTPQEQEAIYQATRNGTQSLFAEPIKSDAYLKFLVKELKPYIDKKYSTYRDRQHTFIAGSSMGGLISWYALCEYPRVFGAAACLSTHWIGIFSADNNPIPGAFQAYLRQHLPNPKRGYRLYFDFGTETLDAFYEPFQQQVDIIMQEKGWSSSTWTTRKFTGADHSERAWQRRLDIPLRFIFTSSGL